VNFEQWKERTKMLSMKWKKDKENHLVSVWQETGQRGRARRDGKLESGSKYVRLPQSRRA
jgi:hypothetical protein